MRGRLVEGERLVEGVGLGLGATAGGEGEEAEESKEEEGGGGIVAVAVTASGGLAALVGGLFVSAVASGFFVVFGVDGGGADALSLSADGASGALDGDTRIIDTGAFEGVADQVFAAEDINAGVGLAISLVAELCGFAGDASARVFDADAIETTFACITLHRCTGFDAVAIAAEGISGAGFSNAGIGFTTAFAAAFAAGAGLGVAIFFDADSLFAEEAARTSEVGTRIDALAFTAHSAAWAADAIARIVFTDAIDAAELACLALDGFARIVFASAAIADLAGGAGDAGARIGLASAIDATLCGGALYADTARDALSVAAEIACIAGKACTRISFTDARTATLVARTTEVVAVLIDALAVFTGLRALALDVFAKIFAIPVDAAQPCCTANERAGVFAALAIDAHAACGALNGGAGIADTLTGKADLTALAGNASARVFLATTIDATLIIGAGGVTGGDALTLDAGGAAGALEIFARIVDAKAVDADLI